MHMWSGADIEIDGSASASASAPRCSWAPFGPCAFCYALCFVAFGPYSLVSLSLFLILGATVTFCS